MVPKGWQGWPEGKKFALILLHDVESSAGRDKCRQIMDLEEELGFRSCFSFVPEDYQMSADLRKEMEKRGFEVAIHGLKHDGKLFASRKIFKERTAKINQYLKEWNAVGFSSPSMHHNLEWMHELNIKYDISTFDTDPFEPQSDGVCTIFPFQVKRPNGKFYIELPHTLPQDFTLFVLMQNKTIDIWKKKLDWIAQKGGMVLVNTHPDYIDFGSSAVHRCRYPVEYYTYFLRYVRLRYGECCHFACPAEVAGLIANMSECQQTV
ncbi:MAG: hypothetical protein JW768_12555 [Chitinispirillaceae bacterium]|nr:hypothetical protein [Chitinispirillaceae bacterium]